MICYIEIPFNTSLTVLVHVFVYLFPSILPHGFAPGFVNYKKVCTRLAAASDKAYQLFAHDQWFSLGTLASSITKTSCHDIAEILLKVTKSTKKNKSIHLVMCCSLVNIECNLLHLLWTTLIGFVRIKNFEFCIK